ncbi:MAG: hypothetical protein ACAI25_12605 [Planctomycetota bacterium]
MSDPAPSPLVRRELKTGEAIIWSGRPIHGLAPGDGEAALVAAVSLFGALGVLGAFHVTDLVNVPSPSLPIAGLAGCILGLVFIVTRVAAAGRSLTFGLAGLAPLFVVAACVGGLEKAKALVCPACSLAFLLLWVALRWVEHRAVRYHLSAERGFIEEPGRYVICFEIADDPVARPSRLAQGRVGSIDLLAARGTIRTTRGVHMAVPAGRRRFVRVRFPADVVRTFLDGGSSGGTS